MQNFGIDPIGHSAIQIPPNTTNSYCRQGLRTQCCMFKSHLPLEPRLAMDKGRGRVHDGTHKVARVVVAEL